MQYQNPRICADREYGSVKISQKSKSQSGDCDYRV